MSGMDALTPRSKIAGCLSNLEETKAKPVGSGADPHMSDHYFTNGKMNKGGHGKMHKVKEDAQSD